MTVEGSYQNLRRFLRDLETSQQFMIVSAVELEPSEKQDQQQTDGSTVAQTQQAPQITGQNQPYARVDQNSVMNNPAARNQVPQMQPVPPQTSAPRGPRGKTIGETVSLRVELAAYFKRNQATALPQ
jgi:hypothetical protein